MSTEEIYSYFFIWLSIAVVLVLAAAGLLIAVVWCAHRIGTLAGVALQVLEGIEDNTKPIWQLNDTNSVAENLLGGAKAIESNAGKIVGALTEGEKSNAA